MSKIIELEPWKPEQANAEQEQDKAQEILDHLENLPVEGQGGIDFAAEALKEVKGRIKALEETRKTATKPMTQALEAVRSWFRGPIKHYEACEKILKSKIADAHTKAVSERQTQLEAASAASMRGDKEEATSLIEQAKDRVQAPKGISFREKWDFEITDISKVPAQYLCVDYDRVIAEVRKNKEETKIPGIRPVVSTTVAASSK